MWGGILAAVFAIMQLLCGPTVGNLSDRYGRRPVLLVSLFFMALDYLILGVAHAMWLLIVGRIIGGITASTPATVAAFIADISKPEEKAKNFGLIGAAFGVGFVLGPLLGAALSRIRNPRSVLRRRGVVRSQSAIGLFRASGDGHE